LCPKSVPVIILNSIFDYPNVQLVGREWNRLVTSGSSYHTVIAIATARRVFVLPVAASQPLSLSALKATLVLWTVTFDSAGQSLTCLSTANLCVPDDRYHPEAGHYPLRRSHGGGIPDVCANVSKLREADGPFANSTRQLALGSSATVLPPLRHVRYPAHRRLMTDIARSRRRAIS
jgi:hypothetical protein